MTTPLWIIIAIYILLPCEPYDQTSSKVFPHNPSCPAYILLIFQKLIILRNLEGLCPWNFSIYRKVTPHIANKTVLCIPCNFVERMHFIRCKNTYAIKRNISIRNWNSYFVISYRSARQIYLIGIVCFSIYIIHCRQVCDIYHKRRDILVLKCWIFMRKADVR